MSRRFSSVICRSHRGGRAGPLGTKFGVAGAQGAPAGIAGPTVEPELTPVGGFRRLALDIAVYATGDVLLRAAALVTVPVYTRLFAPAVYGVWSLATSVVALVSAVLILGGDIAYGRYFFAARTADERRTLTTTWLGFLGAWSLVAVAVFFPARTALSHWLFGDGYERLLLVTLLSAPVTLVHTMTGQVLRNQFRAALFVTLNVLTMTASVAGGLIGVLVFDGGVTGLAAGTLIGSAALLPVRLWSIRSMLCRRFSARILRELLAFGVPLVPASLAFWVFATSDRVVLAKLSSLREVGVYSIAAGVASLIALLISSLGQAWTPHAVRVYEHEPEGASEFYARTLVYILFGFGFLSVMVTAFAPIIVDVISTGQYSRAALAVGPLALAMVASATTQVTYLGMALAKRTSLLTYVTWVAAVVNVALNLALVPIWGMLASAVATTIAYILLTLGFHVVSQRLVPVSYDTRLVLSIVSLIVAFTTAASFLPTSSTALRAASAALLSCAFVICVYAIGAVDRRDRNAVALAAHDLRTWLRDFTS